MTIKAIVHEEDGGYWAEVPSMPGCYTQADTMEELVVNLYEAIELWLEVDATTSAPPAPDPGTREIALTYAAGQVAQVA
jgi:predicted RNase H-like HicB family nuclease